MAKEYNANIEESTYVISYYDNPDYTIDVSYGSKVNNSNVWLYKLNNSAAQKWKIKKDSVGYITFINVGSDKALDVAKASATNDSNIWQHDFNDSYAQKWIAKENSDGSLTFVSALDSNYVLDIHLGFIQNQSNIQLHKSNGTNAQKFKLTKI